MILICFTVYDNIYNCFLAILIHVRDLIEQQIRRKKEDLLQISINTTIVVPSFCNQMHRRIVLQGIYTNLLIDLILL